MASYSLQIFDPGILRHFFYGQQLQLVSVDFFYILALVFLTALMDLVIVVEIESAVVYIPDHRMLIGSLDVVDSIQTARKIR